LRQARKIRCLCLEDGLRFCFDGKYIHNSFYKLSGNASACKAALVALKKPVFQFTFDNYWLACINLLKLMMHELPASAEQHQLATIGNDTPGPIGGQVADLVSTGYSLTPFNFLISSYFLFFYIFSLLIIFILVSSSLFSLFLCRSVFFFVSCLSMNHLHSPGTFPTLFLETMPGSRHSYFHFLFS
jgi:hypothetical protein